jgi:DUF971 family protein
MTRPTAINYFAKDRVLEITWPDTGLQRLPARLLRQSCPCASCVDEHTGVRTLDVAAVPGDMDIEEMHAVGDYAVQFTFSDRHDTGIFTWDYLRRLTDHG